MSRYDAPMVWIWSHARTIALSLVSLLLVIGLGLYLAESLWGPGPLGWGDSRTFLTGKTSHGHHQIEMACKTCHEPFADDLNKACQHCHQAELKAVEDSHAAKLFRDPRNADYLTKIDALNCSVCHAEHSEERTRPMAVTQPVDFCLHCHEDIAEDRPSHKDLPFDGCSDCHNYHDNQALYEDFLVKHLNEPKTHANPVLPSRTPIALPSHFKPSKPGPLTAADAQAPQNIDPKTLAEWAASGHAQAGVNCMDCHGGKDKTPWQDQPGLQGCERCHKDQTDGFTAGRHGMRLAAGLAKDLSEHLGPMTVAEARIPMHPDAADRELGCASCHSGHELNTQKAAVKSCLDCHQDEHSKAYIDSPHHKLWQREQAGTAPTGSGVSCASCHLPRLTHRRGGKDLVRVEHNQNANLRPNQKQVRSVCLHCHGLEFSLNALADKALINNNFNAQPGVQLESMAMAEKRLTEKNKKPSQTQTLPTPKGKHQ